MEFKGTKGKWGVKLHDGKYWKVINENNETICNINSRSTLKIKEENANAQLISHAPELIDALHEIVCAFENNALTDVSFAKELIKSATEVNNDR